MRRAVASIVLLLVVVLFCQTWIAEGLFIPLGIPSGSMAETLLGPHCRFTCPECGESFACDTDVSRVGQWRVCPYCGNVAENTSPLEVIDGDRVIVFRSAFDWRRPRRWEVIAFRDPNRPNRLAVKRVVGLPGESVVIRDGDVYVNGQLECKNLDDQLAMCVLVSEDRNREKTSWSDETPKGQWTRRDGRFEHPAATGHRKKNDEVDWLVYHHYRRQGQSWSPGPVTDELAYNQWRSPRDDEIHPVADLLLKVHVGRIAGDGWLVLRATDGVDRLEAWIRPKDGVCEFRFNGQLVRRGPSPLGPMAEEMDVVFSVIDHQAVLTLNGRPTIGRLLLPADRRWTAFERPWAVGVAGLGVELSRLQVFRDLYYTRPPGVLARWGFDRPVVLGPDEYFVLGDNSLVSEDSRSWPVGPGVRADFIVGKPRVVLSNP